MLDDAWILAGKDPLSEDGFTFDSVESDERIDYILLSNDMPISNVTCEVMTGLQGSDHLAVVAKMDVS